MRITIVRKIVQVVMFGLFMAFCLLTSFAYLDRLPGLRFWLGKFLEIDPLVSLATAVTTHSLYRGLLWSLLLLVPTLLLGRFFCDWICPYGILHHFVGWAFGLRNDKRKIESNQYRRLYGLKYYILIGMLAAALFGSLQVGLLDPICLIHRSFTVAVEPAWDMAIVSVERPLETDFSAWRFRRDPGVHQLGWVIGFILFVLVALNLLIPRFFCRVLCPLGALLGLLSRYSLWRIERDPARCVDCNLCLRGCEGACDPQTNLRKSECFVCFNCIEDCPHGALSLSFLPLRTSELTGPDIPRRRVIFATVVGLLFFPFARASGKSGRRFSSKVIRPPGAVEEQEFLQRCIKCGQCIRICPTNVLQPAMFEPGVEGIWTPIMDFRVGFCQPTCTACGQVCPTGAIQPLSVSQKLGLGPYAQQGPIRLGTAHYDRGRCLPWSKNIPCVVCEEVCPTSPKAIYSERMQLTVRDGKKQVLSATDRTVRVAEHPRPGEAAGRPTSLAFNQYVGDQTTSYFVELIHRDGTREVQRIVGNDVDTLMIANTWHKMPQPGEIAVIKNEFRVPKIDVSLCIGCGLCEHECPVVGDRRAVYVTPEGETRSQLYQDPDRNRSVRLIKTARADDTGRCSLQPPGQEKVVVDLQRLLA